MKTYKTSEVANVLGVHPNTVRLYEQNGFISAPKRTEKGYRVYTDLHIAQMRLSRTAVKNEIIQNGLRKKSICIARLSACGQLKEAIANTKELLAMIEEETRRAQDAISYVETAIARNSDVCVILSQEDKTDEDILLTRKQAAQKLGVTTDTLRNWELNGLFTIKRSANGYRAYNKRDMEQLSLIRTLRCANYSLASILRLKNSLATQKDISVSAVLNTPEGDEEIISVCDRLLLSLAETKADTESMLQQLKEMSKIKPST